MWGESLLVRRSIRRFRFYWLGIDHSTKTHIRFIKRRVSSSPLLDGSNHLLSPAPLVSLRSEVSLDSIRGDAGSDEMGVINAVFSVFAVPLAKGKKRE